MSTYELNRSTTIDAEAARVHALVNDFREWQKWSPWEDLDPNLKRTYSGPESGVGAHYAWSGNRKAGEGSMVITAVTPLEIDVKLDFLKPFSASNQVQFILVPEGTATTKVEWRMEGEQKGFWGLVGRFMNMDKLVGKDFEKGLARLKTAAEA
jgi:hypothetical protein